MAKHIVIRLDLSDDPHPDVGLHFCERCLDNNLKQEVYTYLRDLMDDDSLDFEVVDEKEEG